MRKSMLDVWVPGSFSNIGDWNLRPRVFRPCGTMWFKLGKNWRSPIKNQLTQTDSAVNAWQSRKLSKNHGDLVLPDSYYSSKFKKSADIRRHKHFLWTLHSSNSVRMHRIIIVLLPFLISIQWTIGLCKLIFNWAPLIFTQFGQHGFTCSEPCCAHINRPLFWKLQGLGISSMNFLIADVI